jgi:acyl carrier protein
MGFPRATYSQVDEKAQEGYNNDYSAASQSLPTCGGETMDVFEKIQEIIVEHLEVEPELVTREASLRETLGADSLDLVDLLMEFEDALRTVIPDAEIPDEDVQGIVTVGDAVDYITKRLEAEA